MPSLRLLVSWQKAKPFMNSYLWPDVPHLPSDQWSHVYSPVDQSREALEYWLGFSDQYQFPHIQYFDDFEGLFELMASVDLLEISEQMKAHNQLRAQNIIS